MQYLFGGDDVEVRNGATPRLVPAGSAVLVYTDPAGLIPATGLKSPGGADLSVVTVDGASKISPFYLEADDQDTLYVRVNGGPLTAIRAQANARITELEPQGHATRVKRETYYMDNSVQTGYVQVDGQPLTFPAGTCNWIDGNLLLTGSGGSIVQWRISGTLAVNEDGVSHWVGEFTTDFFPGTDIRTWAGDRNGASADWTLDMAHDGFGAVILQPSSNIMEEEVLVVAGSIDTMTIFTGGIPA
jgi:hypothetical protein